MSSYTLIDAAERNAKCPETFEIPLKGDRETVPIGHLVKLGFAPKGSVVERMWVRVTAALRGSDTVQYLGTLSNEPTLMDDLSFGDEIEFAACHIFDIAAPSVNA